AKAAAEVKEESARVIEAEIRRQLKKPTGELTKADLEKVTRLNLDNNQLTDVKGLEKLTQLTKLRLEDNQLTNVKGLEKLTQLKELNLTYNPDLTNAQIDELKKALPKCKFYSNAKK
ncbi:MAG: leucine-rich repeat domain-containing protein, partial [Pirellulales bacterium]|nr:leucine-rich repeat domain-containing protein [Pirellulales bacterium]